MTQAAMFVVGECAHSDEAIRAGAEVLLDVGPEVLCGLVLLRFERTFQFEPWGRQEITLSLSRVVAVALPAHSPEDRAEATARQRAGYSAAPPACETTPVKRPGRVALPIDSSAARNSQAK